MDSNLEQASQLDLQLIYRLLLQSKNDLMRSASKDIVLIVGNSNAGKSTLANYLLGCKMQVKELPDGSCVDIVPGQPRYAAIGHQPGAETFTPNVVSTPEWLDTALCDCPGFGDNRTNEEVVCNSININLAIQLSRSVRAIIVVVDTEALYLDNGRSMTDLAALLSVFVQDLACLERSCIWVFNKQPKKTRDHIINKINSMINFNDKLIRRIRNSLASIINPESQDLKRAKIVEFLRLMQNSSENIVKFDPLDKGESRSVIMEKLRGMPTVPHDSFKSEYDEARVQFDEFVYNMASDMIRLFTTRRQKKEELARSINNLGNLRIGISRYEEMTTESESTNQRRLAQVIQQFGGDLQQQLATKNDRIRELTNELVAEQENLGRLKDEDPTLLYRSIIRSSSFLSWLFSTDIEYSGIPCECVVPNNPEAFIIDFNKSTPGKVKAKIKLAHMTWFQHEQLKLDIYVKKKDLPSTIHSIKEKERLIASKKEELKDLDEQVKRLSDDLDDLSKREITRRDLARTKDEKENEARELEAKIRNLTQEVETLDVQCDNSQNYVGFISDMSEIIEFREEIIRQFFDCVHGSHEAEQESVNESMNEPVNEPVNELAFQVSLVGSRHIDQPRSRPSDSESFEQFRQPRGMRMSEEGQQRIEVSLSDYRINRNN